MLVAAVVLVLFFVNELFFQSEPVTYPLPSEKWPPYEETASPPPTVTAAPTPTPVPTKVPEALIGLVDPNATAPSYTSSVGFTPSSSVTATPTVKPTATPTRRPTPSPTPRPTATPTSSALRNGSEGNSVRTVQRRLRELGYLSGSADGVFGDATEAAVKAFQAANGLRADGVVGSATLEMLNSSRAKAASTQSLAKATSKPTPKSYTPSEPENYRYLQLGVSGGDVRRLQNRLIELGYLQQSATGTYDEATEAAVIAFQKRNGQWVDGVAGEDTQTVLFSRDALPAANH